MRIAMIGQRGLPAAWGGVERHVEELGARLVERGHDVTVFCRTNYSEVMAKEYRGMHLRYLPTVGTKHLETITHSALSSLSALRGRFDIVHFHALGPGLLSPVPRALSKAGVVQTIHGLDNKRAKWGPMASAVLGTAAWVSGHVPHATIGVSEDLVAHYAKTWNRVAHHVPNGVNPPEIRQADEITRRYGLRAGEYLLFVGRFVPEKAPDRLVRAFASLPGDLRLVLAGGSSYTDGYARSLADAAAEDPRVLLPGYVFGDTLAELYSNAAAFVQPSDLEGLPITLLEAASYGTPIVASDIPPHVEVLRETGPGRRLVPARREEALAEGLRLVLQDPKAERDGAAKLRDEVLAFYDWDLIAASTERVYDAALSSARRRR
jgi:glycosyltransferase involved in cell wall biosynthesis